MMPPLPFLLLPLPPPMVQSAPGTSIPCPRAQTDGGSFGAGSRAVCVCVCVCFRCKAPPGISGGVSTDAQKLPATTITSALWIIFVGDIYIYFSSNMPTSHRSALIVCDVCAEGAGSTARGGVQVAALWHEADILI